MWDEVRDNCMFIKTNNIFSWKILDLAGFGIFTASWWNLLSPFLLNFIKFYVIIVYQKYS